MQFEVARGDRVTQLGHQRQARRVGVVGRRRRWQEKRKEQAAVYANRRRIRGERGKRLLRQRGEKIERSFAHLYETGGLRRLHLRRHPNILKRLLVHGAAFNLGLVMRQVFGKGTPRGLQDYSVARFLTLWWLLNALESSEITFRALLDTSRLLPDSLPSSKALVLASDEIATSATGC